MRPRLKKIVMWALTYRCNMTCEYCFLREKIKCWDEVSDDDCLRIAEKMASDLSWKPDAVWLTGGEPTVRKCLPKIIRILENSGIKCIVTTNGLCSNNMLQELIAASPRGINVSLESFDDEVNNESRGHTKRIVQSLEEIGRTKSPYTTLGVSCVISPEAIEQLACFAKNIKNVGVEYLSMNPLIGGNNCYHEEDFKTLKEMRERVAKDIGLLVPSEFYFSLVEDCHLNRREICIPCPAGESYLFISPWGDVFPCSNEFWQTQDINNVNFLNEESFTNVFCRVRERYGTDDISTGSACFGERCIGCWKLYYDTIFTEGN